MSLPREAERNAAIEAVREWLAGAEIDSEESIAETGEAMFSFALPGERKLTTAVRLDVGGHALSIHAFVCRKPDENFQGVYGWLLERNMKMYAVAFGIDAMGDIYLDARLPLASATVEELDRVMGSVLSNADGSFNTLVELGFASSIRKEWEWRLARGESTANLAAFQSLKPTEP